jgi:hypothetical protein
VSSAKDTKSGGKIKIVSRFRSYKIGVNKQKRASFSFLIKGKKEAQKGVTL